MVVINRDGSNSGSIRHHRQDVYAVGVVYAMRVGVYSASWLDVAVRRSRRKVESSSVQGSQHLICLCE